MPGEAAPANAPQPSATAKPTKDDPVTASRSGFDQMRHCEERSDEAIQHSGAGVLDCFAALAMTMGGARNDDGGRSQ
jgi:hypothetical protein